MNPEEIERQYNAGLISYCEAITGILASDYSDWDKLDCIRILSESEAQIETNRAEKMITRLWAR